MIIFLFSLLITMWLVIVIFLVNFLNHRDITRKQIKQIISDLNTLTSVAGRDTVRLHKRCDDLVVESNNFRNRIHQQGLDRYNYDQDSIRHQIVSTTDKLSERIDQSIMRIYKQERLFEDLIDKLGMKIEYPDKETKLVFKPKNNKKGENQ